MQGRPLPKDRVFAASKLPKARNPPENLQGQEAPISFLEPDDRSGQAKSHYNRRKRSAVEMELENKDEKTACCITSRVWKSRMSRLTHTSTSLIAMAPAPAPITFTGPSFMIPA